MIASQPFSRHLETFRVLAFHLTLVLFQGSVTHNPNGYTLAVWRWFLFLYQQHFEQLNKKVALATVLGGDLREAYAILTGRFAKDSAGSFFHFGMKHINLGTHHKRWITDRLYFHAILLGTMTDWLTKRKPHHKEAQSFSSFCRQERTFCLNSGRKIGFCSFSFFLIFVLNSAD